MPFRDTNSKRFTGSLRWRRGDVFDTDERDAALLAGAVEITREEGAEIIVEGPPAPMPARPKAPPLTSTPEPGEPPANV